MEVTGFWRIVGCVMLISIAGSCGQRPSTSGSHPINDDGVWVGAFYYPWYGPDRHWGDGYRGTPLLGEYDSTADRTIQQHIDWAQEYGIDFYLSIEPSKEYGFQYLQVVKDQLQLYNQKNK